jgi:hypothetical protein
VSAGAAQEVDDLVVARLATGTPPAIPGADAGWSPGAGLGWAPGAGFAPLAPGTGPLVQRAVDAGAAAAPAAPGETAGAAAGTVAGGEPGGPDYEEMAEQIYDRIRSRFASELLLDRERMGLLIDG